MTTIFRHIFWITFSISLVLTFTLCWGLSKDSLYAQGNPVSGPLSLSFAGDIMAHDSNYKMQDFSRIYRGIKHLLQQTELNFGNLEFVIDPQRPYSSYPTFNVHKEYIDAAIDAGFTTFSLANNHSADFGLSGIRATQQSSDRLKQEHSHLVFSGLRPSNQPPDSFLMEQVQSQGWDIGFTALSILSNSSEGIEGLQYIQADDTKSLQAFYRWLAQQKTHFDLIVVSVHGGVEYQLEPSEQKRKIMRQLADNGADIVWGHHPHVQQPWEIYQHSTNKALWSLIMYSQGNFISAQTIRTKADQPHAFWAATGDSVLLQVRVGRSASGQLDLLGLKPQLLTTIRLSPFAFGVVPMAGAAVAIRQQGYSGWDDFYAQRQVLLEQRVAQWPHIP